MMFSWYWYQNPTKIAQNGQLQMVTSFFLECFLISVAYWRNSRIIQVVSYINEKLFFIISINVQKSQFINFISPIGWKLKMKQYIFWEYFFWENTWLMWCFRGTQTHLLAGKLSFLVSCSPSYTSLLFSSGTLASIFHSGFKFW